MTNFVRQADPSGERTLLVLTKVDRAVADPVRLKQILDGKLLPLRALGYFAVVSGTDDRDASIGMVNKSIFGYTRQFFFLSNGKCKKLEYLLWNLLNIIYCRICLRGFFSISKFCASKRPFFMFFAKTKKFKNHNNLELIFNFLSGSLFIFSIFYKWPI